MSVIFGMINDLDYVVEKRDLMKLAECTFAYAPDGTTVYAKDNVGMGYQPYRTHQRSHLERSPLCDPEGNVLSFDGRLDNYCELCDLLGVRQVEVSDSEIVIRSFVKWGEGCFSRFIGEWALVLWSRHDRSLYLARDHAGTRTLYFERSRGCVRWSTYLETFFCDGETFNIDEEFAALYFSCQPTRERTPFRGIQAVPPAHYIRIRNGRVTCKAHWEWIVKDSIIYDKDLQYEEHFLKLFRQSVQRRTGMGAPIIAQLSGGMDSTSIVCMSDLIRRAQGLSIELIDTISYFDNSEPNWDEVPFFTSVEKARQKVGIHLDISYSDREIRPQSATKAIQLWPGADSSGADLDGRLHEAFNHKNYRAILSGLGGDEVLGGVPVPSPELANLLVHGNLMSLLARSVEWCIATRVPLLHLLPKMLRYTYDLYFTGSSTPRDAPPWLNRKLQRRDTTELTEMSTWDRLHCSVPSKIANGEAWWSILETLPTRLLSSAERYEYRYPYLDRDLVEFLFRIPRSQIVEPGRRRSLMRRALKNIIPDQVLERRRKAYIIRGPINLIRREREWISDQFRHLRCAELGLVNPSGLQSGLESIATGGDPRWMAHLMRLIGFELWLRSAPIAIPPSHYKWGGEKDPSQTILSRTA